MLTQTCALVAAVNHVIIAIVKLFLPRQAACTFACALSPLTEAREQRLLTCLSADHGSAAPANPRVSAPHALPITHACRTRVSPGALEEEGREVAWEAPPYGANACRTAEVPRDTSPRTAKVAVASAVLNGNPHAPCGGKGAPPSQTTGHSDGAYSRRVGPPRCANECPPYCVPMHPRKAKGNPRASRTLIKTCSEACLAVAGATDDVPLHFIDLLPGPMARLICYSVVALLVPSCFTSCSLDLQFRFLK